MYIYSIVHEFSDTFALYEYHPDIYAIFLALYEVLSCPFQVNPPLHSPRSSHDSNFYQYRLVLLVVELHIKGIVHLLLVSDFFVHIACCCL